MKTLLTSLIFMSAASVAYADSFDVFGLYATDDKGSHVLIEDCGDGTPCGKVVWIDPEGLNEGQTPETLITRDGRTVLGLQILEGYSKKLKDWRGGKIYSPSDDKSFGSRLKRLEDGSLRVKGCIGPFCQTQIWTPVLS